MAYQWKVGELAVCIKTSRTLPEHVTRGTIDIIRTICEHCESRDGHIGYGLKFYNIPDHPHANYWDARIFRPLNKDDLKRIREKHETPRMRPSIADWFYAEQLKIILEQDE